MTEPWNAPPPGATPTMDGFVTDYISTFTGEMGRQPTYDEYAHIMTGYTPEQLPVLNGIAREFGVFDHWFSEVPSQTFMNRSFWTAATSSGIVVNSPVKKWFTQERRGDDLRTARATRQDLEDLRDGADGAVVPRHHPLLPPEGPAGNERGAVRRVREDAAAGTLPDFSLIEPNFISGHGDYHPAFGRSLGRTVDADAGSSVLDAGRRSVPGAHLQRLPLQHLRVGLERLEHRSADRLGRAGRNLRPRAARTGPTARPGRPAGELGFKFDRSGYRVPAILVSPWVPQGSVFNDEYRHTSLIATLRKSLEPRRGLHPARRLSAHLRRPLHPRKPRDPETWATVTALPVPSWHLDEEALSKALSGLGKSMGQGIIEHARELGLELPPQLRSPTPNHTPGHHRGLQAGRRALLPPPRTGGHSRRPLSERLVQPSPKMSHLGPRFRNAI